MTDIYNSVVATQLDEQPKTEKIDKSDDNKDSTVKYSCRHSEFHKIRQSPVKPTLCCD